MTVEEILERRVDYLVDFVVAMKDNDLSPKLLDEFKTRDRDSLTHFCYAVDVEPEPYLARYDRGVGE